MSCELGVTILINLMAFATATNDSPLSTMPTWHGPTNLRFDPAPLTMRTVTYGWHGLYPFHQAGLFFTD